MTRKERLEVEVESTHAEYRAWDGARAELCALLPWGSGLTEAQDAAYRLLEGNACDAYDRWMAALRKVQP